MTLTISNQKIGYVNLTTGEIRKEYITTEMRKFLMGSRGFNMYLMHTLTPKGIDAFDPKSWWFISCGVLGGMLVPSCSRTQISGLSPLTGAVGDSNMGGFLGVELRYAGFDTIAVTGKAEKPVYLFVHDDEIEILDAGYLWGTDTSECSERLKAKHKDYDIKAAMIGQGGENLVRYANVRNGLKSSAGRTGMGALMGSKNLKCVAAKGTNDLPLYQPEEALANWKAEVAKARERRMVKTLLRFGKGIYFGNTNTVGLLRAYNFKQNQMLYADDLEVESMDRFTVGREGCFGCQIHCRHRWRVPEGPFKGHYGVGPEYTSLGSMGTEIGNVSMDVCLAADDLVNKWGVDNLEAGSMIAWAMEIYEKGIITKEDTGGLELKWGDPEVIYELLRQITFREGFGDILAEGPLRAAEKIGKGSDYYLIQVKGMSNLQSDERATPSLALNVAVSTRGSDHLRGRPVPDLFGLPKDVLERMYGGEQTTDFNSYMGKPRMVWHHEISACTHDTIGNCGMGGQPDMPYTLKINTGLEFTDEEMWTIGERIHTIERLFNQDRGFGRKEDHLCERYYVEPTTMGMPKARGKTIDRDKFEIMLDEYYELHGCDSEGHPTKETIKRLGLDNEPSYIIGKPGLEIALK
jgi:aldehyde:ferredoxin oxidoreductase